MANGIFVAEAGDVEDGKRQLKFLFVFDIDPILIASQSVTPTPANVDGQFMLGPIAALALEAAKPGVVAALDAGTAIYEWVLFSVDDPVDPPTILAQARTLWLQMWNQGQKELWKNRFRWAGQWVDVSPPEL